MAFKDEIIRLAFARAQKAAEVQTAAYELHRAGRLPLEQFLQIQADVHSGLAFKAADTLERLLAVELIKSGVELHRIDQGTHV